MIKKDKFTTKNFVLLFEILNENYNNDLKFWLGHRINKIKKTQLEDGLVTKQMKGIQIVCTRDKKASNHKKGYY